MSYLHSQLLNADVVYLTQGETPSPSRFLEAPTPSHHWLFPSHAFCVTILALLVVSFGCNQNIAISRHLHLLFLLTGTVSQTVTWLVLSFHSDVSSNEVFLDYSIWSSTSVALYPLILLYFLHHTSHHLTAHVIGVIYKMSAKKVEIMQNNSWPALALLVTERKMNIKRGENYLGRSSFPVRDLFRYSNPHLTHEMCA